MVKRLCGRILYTVIIIFAWFWVAFPAAAQLTFTIVNSNPNFSNSNVFFEIEGGIIGTINGQPILSQTSYSIADIGSGMVISNLSGRFYVSLGDRIVSNNYTFSNPDIPSTYVRFDKVEITYGIGNPYSCVNLTAVDYPSIPMQISDPSKTLTWHGYGSMSNVWSQLGALCNNDSWAVWTNHDGQIIRVVSPSAYSQTPNAYPSWQPYLDYVRTNNFLTKVVGGYYTTNTVNPIMESQRYSFTAQVVSNGDLILTGWGEKIGSNHTIRVAAAELDKGIYSADPLYSIDGGTNQHQINSVYDTALRQVWAGFNLGVIGTSATDPRTGEMFTNETTEFWYNENNVATNFLSATNFFGALWGTGTNFYNVYAAFLATNTDAYGFPYTDAYGKPLMWLGGTNNTLTLTILPDFEPVPEPSTIGLVGGALLLFVLRRKNLRKGH